MISRKLRPFGVSIFSTMTRLALEHEALNLAQGFPDFDGPGEIFDLARKAMEEGCNQYARSRGLPVLTASIAHHFTECYGLDYDPETEIVVTCGATEGLAASILGLLDPGDEALLLEPYYDSYPACLAMAGASFRSVPLVHPEFALDLEALESRITGRTRLLLLNDPHNPTGKVLGEEECEALAALCTRHDLLVLEDAVYEQLTYDGRPFRPLAAFPGMRERCLTVSSTGKTFSLTGWKIGWVAGPKGLVDAVQAAHQFLTFAVATPFQAAMAEALRRFGPPYLETFRNEYRERRDLLVEILRDAGFQPAVPQGSYFVLADITGLTDKKAPEFALELIRRVGVAALPVDSFYTEGKEGEGSRLLRFAFCKRLDTLEEARRRLAAL